MGRATLAFLLMLLTPAFASAQSARESWDNLKQLHAGQKIEVIDTSMKSHHGRFVSVSDDTLSLQEGKSEQAIAREQVIRVSIRDTSKRTRNMLIGIGAGAGAGLGAGYLVDEGMRHVSGEGGSYLYTPILAAAGAGLGALVGGLPAGSQTIYRAPKK
jgi:hypothetical protein